MLRALYMYVHGVVCMCMVWYMYSVGTYMYVHGVVHVQCPYIHVCYICGVDAYILLCFLNSASKRTWGDRIPGL